jgi:hypothetical protein
MEQPQVLTEHLQQELVVVEVVEIQETELEDPVAVELLNLMGQLILVAVEVEHQIQVVMVVLEVLV